MKRRRRRNPGWIHEHPWMTFFLASSAINGIVLLVRPNAWDFMCPKPAPRALPDATAGLPVVAATSTPATVSGLGALPIVRAFR